MRTSFNLTCLLILFSLASGCSKFRQLTRRDYALLRDPFATRKGDADSPPPVDNARSTSGYVKLSDAEEQPTDPVRADYSTVSQAKTAEAPGTSEFKGIRVRGMEDTVTNDVGNAVATAGNAAANVTQAARDASNAAMKQELTNVGRATKASLASPPPETGFADWASAKIERWKDEAPNTEDAAAPILNGIKQASVKQDISNTVNTASEKASPYIRGNQEKALPFITSRKQSPRVTQRERLKAKPKPTKVAVEPPPVGNANPFGDLETQPQAASPPPVDKQLPNSTTSICTTLQLRPLLNQRRHLQWIQTQILLRRLTKLRQRLRRRKPRNSTMPSTGTQDGDRPTQKLRSDVRRSNVGAQDEPKHQRLMSPR